MALRDVGAEFESWRTCEWDVNAIRQYKAIHCSDNNQDYSHGKTKEQLVDILLQAGISNDGKKPMPKEKLTNKSEKWLREVYNDCCATLNLVDISKVTGDSLQIEDTNKYCYILTYSFPCQSLSIAGSQDGMKQDSGTASSLLWEVKRVLSECTELPQILLMENVTQVHSKKNLPQFEEWMKFLESLGYCNFWQDMNAKDYGIPQSRNRTFMVSILDYSHQITFEFPKPINLNKEFVDVLVDEDTVEERFYIDSPRARELVQKLVDNGELVTEQRERERESNCRFISQQSETKENCKLHNRTSCTGWELDREATSQKQWSYQFCKKKRDIHFVGNISPINKRQNPNQGRVYMVDGISPTLTGMEGGGRQPHIIVRSAI